MSPLHMLSLAVDLRELRRLCAIHGFGIDEGRALHHFLSETFGKGALQPFRLIPGRNGSPSASLYCYAGLDETGLVNIARETGLPEYARLFDIAHLATKPMPESWPEGRRLAFDVRIRPVRRLFKPLEAETRETRRTALKAGKPQPLGKGAEVDAYLVERLRRNPANMLEAPDGLTREETYRTWLAERLHGALLDPVETRMTACERTRVLRNKTWSEAPDVTFQGEMIITDPETFRTRLARGIGRHTAYGYGMLLLRPARR
jgi:CRISPR system Cascade subunit CasE